MPDRAIPTPPEPHAKYERLIKAAQAEATIKVAVAHPCAVKRQWQGTCLSGTAGRLVREQGSFPTWHPVRYCLAAQRSHERNSSVR